MLEWNTQKPTKLDGNDTTAISHHPYILYHFANYALCLLVVCIGACRTRHTRALPRLFRITLQALQVVCTKILKTERENIHQLWHSNASYRQPVGQERCFLNQHHVHSSCMPKHKQSTHTNYTGTVQIP